MILRILRLFSAFRALESDRDSQVLILREALQQESQRALLLQDRLDSVLNERAQMWDTMRECINGERTAYQAHVNAAWQQKGHGTPYPDAPHIPAHAVPHEQDTSPIARRSLMSEGVARETRRFLETLTKPAA